MLAERVIEFIRNPASDSFDQLALDIFKHQFNRNVPYQSFCRSLGASPSTVRTWRDIPPLSVERFKDACLTCNPAEATFLSTGTTRGPSVRSRHYLARLDVYRVSAMTNFARSVVPDGGKYNVVVLAPPLEETPQSSLAQMIRWVGDEFGVSTACYLRSGKLEEDKLYRDLKGLCRSDIPVLLLCLTVALIELGRAWGFSPGESKPAKHVELPPGSRIMDTGGSKRMGRKVEREEVAELAQVLFGIDRNHLVNEYGMTEMCSQFYDDTFTRPLAEPGCRRKVVPHWVRTLVVDPLTLHEVSDGNDGMLLHFDLANVESVSALLTDDIGRKLGNGFDIRGRLAGAEARGCSLAMP